MSTRLRVIRLVLVALSVSKACNDRGLSIQMHAAYVSLRLSMALSGSIQSRHFLLCLYMGETLITPLCVDIFDGMVLGLCRHLSTMGKGVDVGR